MTKKKLPRKELERQLEEYKKEDLQKKHDEKLKYFSPISDQKLSNYMFYTSISWFQEGYEPWEFDPEEYPELTNMAIRNKTVREHLKQNEFFDENKWSDSLELAEEAYAKQEKENN